MIYDQSLGQAWPSAWVLQLLTDIYSFMHCLFKPVFCAAKGQCLCWKKWQLSLVTIRYKADVFEITPGYLFLSKCHAASDIPDNANVNC